MESEGSLSHSQRPSPVLILSQINPINATIPLLGNPFSYYPPYTAQSPPSKSYIHLSSPPIRATCPAHPILLNLITGIIFGEYRSLGSSVYGLLHSPATSSLFGPNILLSTLFSNTLRLRSTLNVSDQVSRSYKTPGTIIVLYILFFIFFG